MELTKQQRAAINLLNQMEKVKKPYMVEVGFYLAVMAGSKEDAEKFASENWRKITKGSNQIDFGAFEFTQDDRSRGHMREWMDVVPYNSTGNKTIAELLDHSADPF